MAEIVQLLVSPQHRYEGRPGPLSPPADLGPGVEFDGELVDRLEIRAGLGVVGDRYFNRRAHRDAAVTIMAVESLAQWPGVGLTQTRRNVLLRGVDVDSATERTLRLDCGDEPVLLRLRRRAAPCRWMDFAVGDGAWRALRGHGGMRCEPLSDGALRVGPVHADWV